MRKKIMAAALSALLLSAGLLPAAAAEQIDGVTGRRFDCVNIGGHNTSRAYFTQRMWSADSSRLIVRDETDGYLYAYHVETGQKEKLIRARSDFYIAPSDNLYYVESSDRTIRRYNLDTKQTETVAQYPDYVTTPGGLHVSNDESRLVVTWSENLDPLDWAENDKGQTIQRSRRIPVLDIATGEWDLRFSHEFASPYPLVTHIMVNPEYPELVFYCHEGTTQFIPDRLWLLNTKTGTQENVFRQYPTAAGNTGEPSGHENWTADGEHMVFVKYPHSGNLGKSGIVRIDKFGEEREYIDGSYQYWHCHPSSDNRFIVADTQESLSQDAALGFKTGMTDIVLVDSKTGVPQRVTRVKIGADHPWQPHPSFSPDGKKLCFTMIDSSNVLSVGIMDVSDLVDAPEPVNRHVNEDSGLTATSVSKVGDTYSTRVKSIGAETELTLYSAAFDGAHMTAVSSAVGRLSPGESAELSTTVAGEGVRHYLWGGAAGMEPFHLKPTAPQSLRLREAGADTLRLSWLPPENLSDVTEYIIYRNGAEAGRVTDPYFRDSGLDGDTEYRYEVRASFGSGELSPPASGAFRTLGASYARLESAVTEQNLWFLDNAANPAADSYTEPAEIGRRQCRKSTAQVQGDGTRKTGKFYFRTADSLLPPRARRVTVTVTYFDRGVGELRLEYNAVDGTVAKPKAIVRRTNTDTWKTASVTVDDARFVKAKALSDCDFRIEGGEDTYLYEVTVEKAAAEPGIVVQAVQARLGTENAEEGLSLYPSVSGDGLTEAGERGGRECRVAGAGKYYYFDVTDAYMFGAYDNEASVTLEYFDEGTGEIYLEYNTSDAAAANPAYKRIIAGRRTNTETWKRQTIRLIDASFSNLQDAPYRSDFRITAQGGLALASVKVLNGI